VIYLIQKSRLFIGHDGGLMHIAALAGKPTFTIWGPTDYNLYGYEKINSRKHKVISSKVYCHPCESWISPNTIRVTHPSQCPDFMCLQNISADAALKEFQIFYRELFSN
jgi:ADP-heptose:LPS heptosyltransferase